MKILNSIKCKIKEYMLWFAAIVLTLAAFAITYSFNISAPIKGMIWIAWIVLTLAILFFTSKGKMAFTFAKEAKVELQKVVWPTRQETIQTTSIVMIMVAVTGFILWGIDSGMMWVIAKLTHLG